MGTGFSKKKKEARLLQQQFQNYQSEMQQTEVIGLSTQELVSITLTGEGDLKQIKIKPECVDPEDVEGLESLIKSAYQDAQKKIKEKTQGGMPGLSSFGI